MPRAAADQPPHACPVPHESTQPTKRQAQALPAYRGTTTLLLTTDHGRGATTKDWSDHGRDVPAAETTWMAALGPGVPALGIREGVTVTTSQFAATIAAAVGESYVAANTKAAPPLPLVK